MTFTLNRGRSGVWSIGVGSPARDRSLGTGELLAANGLALSAAEWWDRVVMLASMGTTEIAYQPGGPDIPDESERFAVAANATR